MNEMNEATSKNPRGSDNMQSKLEPVCKNELVMDFRDLTYRKSESEMYIQNLEDIKARLKYLHDGYSQDIELQRIIKLLEDYTTKKIEDKTTNNSELFQLETQLLTLIEGSPNNPQRLEG